jgi:hypothetical protein
VGRNHLAETNLPIWTLEARDSVMLDVVQSYFALSEERMRLEILAAHQLTIETLAEKEVPYRSLRNALTPQAQRCERAFLFDTARIEEPWYGWQVAARLIPLLPRRTPCSIRAGDLIISDEELGFELIRKFVEVDRQPDLVCTNQLYCVYVNNLTRTMVDEITEGLRPYEAFMGYVDTSTSSPMKDWLSTTLVDAYLKADGVVLNGHEDDRPDSDDVNLKGWPWEDHGYACRSMRSMYHHLFLSYKIERRVVPGAESDTRFALTAISGQPLPLREIPVEVEAAKAAYIASEHGSGLARAGLEVVSAESLEAMIRAKIENSYIYNLRYEETRNQSFFNIMLEVENPESKAITRLTAALEYSPKVPLLRLVTLF